MTLPAHALMPRVERPVLPRLASVFAGTHPCLRPGALILCHRKAPDPGERGKGSGDPAGTANRQA